MYGLQVDLDCPSQPIVPSPELLQDALDVGHQSRMVTTPPLKRQRVVDAYLESSSFERKKWEVVEEFTALEEFNYLVGDRLEAFKTSIEFKDLLTKQLMAYKVSVEFEDL
ncbi:hypothetical protein L484_016074 [Morus notabilis]|uniref:Uncharacterized protein n=1 Tax=Morus notabilis TaxID=981085 RepID=W9SG65_9ROSA|nr:hypothetical protein L484_016074 [Morus notabilis]